MEDIARTARVGPATLDRRYPDIASIAVALLDAHEKDLQDRLLHGPPPLGPGSPPADRFAAFYAAMVDLLERHGDLGARLRGVRAGWRMEAGQPRTDRVPQSGQTSEPPP